MDELIQAVDSIIGKLPYTYSECTFALRSMQARMYADPCGDKKAYMTTIKTTLTKYLSNTADKPQWAGEILQIVFSLERQLADTGLQLRFPPAGEAPRHWLKDGRIACDVSTGYGTVLPEQSPITCTACLKIYEPYRKITLEPARLEYAPSIYSVVDKRVHWIIYDRDPYFACNLSQGKGTKVQDEITCETCLAVYLGRNNVHWARNDSDYEFACNPRLGEGTMIYNKITCPLCKTAYEAEHQQPKPTEEMLEAVLSKIDSIEDDSTSEYMAQLLVRTVRSFTSVIRAQKREIRQLQERLGIVGNEESMLAAVRRHGFSDEDFRDMESIAKAQHANGVFE